MHDVIIVGGGVSGLTAAWRLKQKGVDNVIVLEAKDRVGGRSFAGEINTGVGLRISRDHTRMFDLGGQWVGPTQHHVLRMLEELGLSTFPQYDTGYNLVRLSDGAVRRYRGTIPRIAPWILLELHFTMRKINRLAMTVNLDNPTLTPNAVSLDAQTVVSAIVSRMKFKKTREIVTVAFRIVFGCELDEISLLYFLWFVKSAGSVEALIDTTGGAQDRKVSGTMYQIPLLLASRVGHDHIRLNSVVQTVQQAADGVTVTLHDGHALKAKYVIMALPPQISVNFAYTPPLPVKRVRLSQHALPGNYTKVFVTYKTAFWRDAGLSGAIVDATSLLSVVFDVCTSDGVCALLVFVGGRFNIEFADREPEALNQAILQNLSEFLGPQALEPVAVRFHDWTHEPHAGGAPVMHYPPGIMSVYGEHMRTPCGRIHWAGTETATQWSGYISGAIQAGERASNEVALLLTTPDPGLLLHSAPKHPKLSWSYI